MFLKQNLGVQMANFKVFFDIKKMCFANTRMRVCKKTKKVQKN